MIKNAGKLREENFKGMKLEAIVAMLSHVLTAPEDMTRECLEAIIEDMESELSGSNTLH
jgi:hypothetical protein